MRSVLRGCCSSSSSTFLRGKCVGSPATGWRHLSLLSAERSETIRCLPCARRSSSCVAAGRHFSTTTEEEEDKEEPPSVDLEGGQEEHEVVDEEDAVDAAVASGLGACLKPTEVVEQLEKYIVGQKDAKRAVAIALRNRWRRHQLPEDIQAEVIPKNILMIGPTGCGKTEIARRIAKLSQAPFIKVEATKFTEVGFHGRDVDQIIRDLVDVSINLTKKKKTEELRPEAQRLAEAQILRALCGPGLGDSRESFKRLLRAGDLETRKITFELPAGGPGAGGGGMGGDRHFQFDASNAMASAEFVSKLQKMVGGKQQMESKNMTIAESRPIIEELELEKLLEQVDITKDALLAVEESGIVFIDEIDKICNSSDYRGADASAEGVQRDLLPLIEGSTISTKHGNINTDYILFISSGAFHSCKPSDLLAELQGRLPIRVELQGLTEEDMYRILTEPVTNLIRQQVELMKTEDVDLVFEEGAIREMARIAAEVNRTVENIGARRLHTIMERIIEEISFDAADYPPNHRLTITKETVSERVSEMTIGSDLSKYIL